MSSPVTAAGGVYVASKLEPNVKIAGFANRLVLVDVDIVRAGKLVKDGPPDRCLVKCKDVKVELQLAQGLVVVLHSKACTKGRKV